MEKEDVIKITNPDGNVVDAQVLSMLENEETGKKYVIYTLDPVGDEEPQPGDEVANVPVYAAIMNEVGEEVTFDPITDKEEWDAIQAEIKLKLEEN